MSLGSFLGVGIGLTLDDHQSVIIELIKKFVLLLNRIGRKLILLQLPIAKFYGKNIGIRSLRSFELFAEFNPESCLFLDVIISAI